MSTKWSLVKLGEVLSHYTEYIDAPEPREYRKLSVKLYGKGVVLDAPANGANLKMMRHQIAKTGQVILSEIWGKKGAIGFVPEEGEGALCTSHFFLFDIDRDKLDRGWLTAIFDANYLQWQLHAEAKGTTGYAAVRPKTLLNCEIPLPPLPEQRRIVARIEELAAKINEARGLRQKALQETERIYASRLSQRMEPNGKGWVRETVADVIVSMDAGWSPQCDDIPARDGEWGVLKTTSVQWSEFRPYENKVLPETLDPVPALAVKEGDVLVTRAGPRKRVGVVAAVRKSEPRLTISDKLIRLRPDPKKIEARFLELSLASPFSQEHLIYRKTGLADAQVNISQSILRATPVAYPSLSEQHRIVTELDSLQSEVHALKQLQADTTVELDALLPSILDKAFKGELR
jgi:type I restriction enzyme, S subunit